VSQIRIKVNFESDNGEDLRNPAVKLFQSDITKRNLEQKCQRKV